MKTLIPVLALVLVFVSFGFGQNLRTIEEQTVKPSEDQGWTCDYHVSKQKTEAFGIQSAINYSIGDQHQLIIMFNYQDNPSNKPWSAAYVSDLYFNQVNAFYQNASYGQAWVTGDNTGWVTITANSTDCQAATTTLAEDAARAAGYEPNNYIHKIYISPSTSCSGTGGVTYYAVNSDLTIKTWTFLNGDASFYAAAHEFGHSLHFYHSNALNCGNQTFAGTCTHVEYGDHHDVMGSYGVTNSPNMYHRDKVGWLDTRVQTIGVDGVFNLTPVEVLDTNLKTIKIFHDYDPVAAATTYYYFEYRQNAGVFLRIGRFDDNLFTGTHMEGLGSEILDCTPLTEGAFDEQLIAGKTYYDANLAILVTVNSFDSNGANVSVGFNAVPPPPPPPPALDTITPTVSIYSPLDGSHIRPKGNMSVYVAAADNIGVASVRLYIDGILKATSTTAPFTTQWNVTKASSGAHAVQCKASDAAGNVGSSAIITVYK